MRPRFSLRALFLATTVAACICFWIVLPTDRAMSLIKAIETRNYEYADGFFSNRVLTDGDSHSLTKLSRLDPTFTANARLHTISLQNLWRGERTVTIYLSNHEILQNTWGFLISVNRSEAQVPPFNELYSIYLQNRSPSIARPPSN